MFSNYNIAASMRFKNQIQHERNSPDVQMGVGPRSKELSKFQTFNSSFRSVRSEKEIPFSRFFLPNFGKVLCMPHGQHPSPIELSTGPSKVKVAFNMGQPGEHNMHLESLHHF